MLFARRVLAACAGAAVVLVVPATAGAATALAYYTGTPQCTTKDAQRTSRVAPQPNTIANDSWMQTAPQSHFPMPMLHDQTPNDVPTLSMFPTVFSQPSDDEIGLKATPALPPTISLGKQILLVSTCNVPS